MQQGFQSLTQGPETRQQPSERGEKGEVSRRLDQTSDACRLESGVSEGRLGKTVCVCRASEVARAVSVTTIVLGLTWYPHLFLTVDGQYG